MEIHVTRASVAAGDDADAPHRRHFSFPHLQSIEEAIEAIAAEGYLASINGGHATWSAVSGFPVSVVAQQWSKPRAVGWRAVDPKTLQCRDGVVGLHFNYHAQLDPEIVLEVLKRLQLHAF